MANPKTLATVYEYLADYIAEHEMAPSQREIARDCFISPPTVLRYLDILEAQGRIEHLTGVARGIRLVKHEACETD